MRNGPAFSDHRPSPIYPRAFFRVWRTGRVRGRRGRYGPCNAKPSALAQGHRFHDIRRSRLGPIEACGLCQKFTTCAADAFWDWMLWEAYVPLVASVRSSASLGKPRCKPHEFKHPIAGVVQAAGWYRDGLDGGPAHNAAVQLRQP